VKTLVSQGTMLIDGEPACARCGIRPRRPVPPAAKTRRRWGRAYYSYCGPCHSEYTRERRRGKIETLVSPEELQLLRELRAAPAGKHHASA
jgi:hypothetical protein